MHWYARGKRIRHPIPTLHDISRELNGAKFFTKLDLTQAYGQLKLASVSRPITTFITHTELYCFKRLNYGTNSAAGIFQHALQQVLHDIPGVRNIADDILVFGSSYKAHNKALDQCQHCLDMHGFLQPKQRTEFIPTRRRSLPWLMVLCLPRWVRSEAFSAILTVHISSPILRPSPNLYGCLHTKEQPLYVLKNVKMPITFSEMLSLIVLWWITSMSIKSTKLTVDASPVGLSAMVVQRDSPSSFPNAVAYASRTFTATKRRYSQTEKEALAVMWGIKYFHLYLYGATFTLYTDHKALEVIFGNPFSKPTTRIDRWFLRLQQYKFSVVYTSGSRNRPDSKQNQTNIADNTAVLPALTMARLAKQPARIQCLVLYVQQSWQDSDQTVNWNNSNPSKMN